ncbi:hypothetical protein [Fictibacillus phosphorivorans]|uniref:hypothetical protein n=1 Tax=Fictibacillus phosphorivorans TaxID=1221500 RepID=UPI0012934F90|nr:hypothetical protein [Fictibacillus phosphorivorans]MQR94693.1 hypothetical protein [Fictibacillus phosphorivorans]
MIWIIYLILFILSFTLSVLGAQTWVFVTLLVLFVAGTFLALLYPLIWQKDAEKVKRYLLKSKQPYHRFLYAFLYEEEREAETRLTKIKQAQAKKYAEIMLYTQQERWDDAKELLKNMKKSDLTLYYSAIVAMEEGRQADYEQHKNQLKDPHYVTWLTVEELRRKGNKNEALTILENQINTLGGLKLLSALHYKNKLQHSN